MDFTGLLIQDLPFKVDSGDFKKWLTTVGCNYLPYSIKANGTNGKYSLKLEFSKHDEAADCKKNANYKLYNNAILWIVPLISRTDLSNCKNSNLFVYIPITLKPIELEQIMSLFGNIFSIKYNYRKNGVPTGTAYVCYFNKDDKNKAILKIGGYGIDVAGGKIQVSEYKPTLQREAESKIDVHSLKLTHVDLRWTNDSFIAFSSTYGPVQFAFLDSGKPGIGYIKYTAKEDAKKALLDINENAIKFTAYPNAEYINTEDSKQLFPLFKYAKSNVFVKRLPLDITESMLMNACKAYGEIKNVRIFMKPVENINTKEHSLVSGGYGFVCFEKEECANKFIEDVMVNKKKICNMQIYAALSRNEQAPQKCAYLDIQPPPVPTLSKPDYLKQHMPEISKEVNVYKVKEVIFKKLQVYFNDKPAEKLTELLYHQYESTILSVISNDQIFNEAMRNAMKLL